MADNDRERRLLAALPDVLVPASLDPETLAPQLPAMARRVKTRRTRRAVTFAVCFVLLAGASAAMAPRFLAKTAADSAAEESAVLTARAEDAAPECAFDSAAGAPEMNNSAADGGDAPSEPLLDEEKDEDEEDKDEKDESSPQVNE
ncbi:MAG: hypothetical protein VB092_08180 [Oscillospiraceae bacterium]|nr:hypothetical protein [Oscillospiraceae bacterium]